MTRVITWIGFIWVGLALVFGLAISLPASAQAGQITPTPVSKCYVCHQDLYYLYDTGKWYCECGVPMDCLCCHGGDPQAVTEEEAHLGMVAKPLTDDATACQRCHPADFQERAGKVAAALGVAPAHPTSSITATPTPTAAALAAGTGWRLDARLLEPGRLIPLSLLLVALGVLVYAGYRCWKADCLANRG
jgi:hypothetical protein